MAYRDKNNRVVPSVTGNYNVEITTKQVNKLRTPKLNKSSDAENLKLTATGLADLAKGILASDKLLHKMANTNTLKAYARTEEANQKEWAEVSKNVEGMAKFNPYNRDAFKSLRAKDICEEGMLELGALEAECASMTPSQFNGKQQEILTKVMDNIQAEGLNARQAYKPLTALDTASQNLKGKYVTKNAEYNYNILQNKIATSTAADFGALTANDPEGYTAGWNKALTNMTDMCNGLGINNTTQATLFGKAISQYMTSCIEDIDAEEFVMAVGQTKINGQPLSDFDPDYQTNMQKLLIQAKRAKYESDSLDYQAEQLRLRKAEMAANAELFNLMADPSTSDTAILNKAYSLIQEQGMEAMGFDFLKSVVSDKNTLLNLRSTTTKPEVYNALIGQYLTGDLSQEAIVGSFQNGLLSPQDASSLMNSLNSNNQQGYSEQLTSLKELYLDNTHPLRELSEEDKNSIGRAVYDVIGNPDMSKGDKKKALSRIGKVADYMCNKKQANESHDPMKLLTSNYMHTQRVHTQNIQEAQRYLAQMGLFHNQAGLRDTNIHVTSTMKQGRTINGVTRDHYGTDVETWLGRQVYAPEAGTVIASGYEASMGNYVLYKCGSKGYIKLMHLQSADLPKAGTQVGVGQMIGRVGATGHVTTTNTGILHIECFNTRMQLVDPKQFVRGKLK